MPGLILGMGALLLSLFVLPESWGLYGSLLLLVVLMSLIALSFGSRMTNSGLLQIHPELEEAAAVSGAGFLTTFRRVLAPLLRPTFQSAWLWLRWCSRSADPTVPLIHVVRRESNMTLAVTVWNLYQAEVQGQAGYDNYIDAHCRITSRAALLAGFREALPGRIGRAVSMTLVSDLVAANRILAHHGVLDAYRHVSARNPDEVDTFFLSRSLSARQVGESDIMRFDPAASRSRAMTAGLPYLERFIHAAIYAARPDDSSARSSPHADDLLPFTITSEPFRAVIRGVSDIGMEKDATGHPAAPSATRPICSSPRSITGTTSRRLSAGIRWSSCAVTASRSAGGRSCER